MASNGSAGSDLNDSRRFRDFQLSQNHAYYPRYYPDWQFDPYRSALAEQEERSIKPNVFPVTYDNLGFYGVPPGSQFGTSYKDDSVSTDDRSDSFKSESRRRRCIVVVCIASVVFLIGISIAVGLYFGLYDRPETGRFIASDITTTPEHSTSHTSTSSPSSIVVSYEASLKLDQTYDPALDDPDSLAYRNLKNDVEGVVQKNLQGSDLESVFVEAVVTGFRRGSIEALLKLDFKASEVVISNRVETLDRTIIESELRQELKKDTEEVNRLKILLDDTVVETLPGTGGADLGERCSSIQDCSDRYTQCLGSPRVCTCTDGYYDSNGPQNVGGTCNPKIPYNSSESTRDVCTEARQCTTEGAVCRDGVCLCPTSYFYKNDACHLKIEIDHTGCELSGQCATLGAVCISGTCTCSATDFYNGNQCTQKISINSEGCVLSSHCATPGAVCTSSTCICNPSSHYFDGQSCAILKSPGQSCTSDQECSEPTLCVNSVCECPSNMYFDSQTCLPKKANGVDCSSDVECLVSNAICDNMSGKCSCTSAMYLDGSICKNKKGYGEQCTSAVECLITGSVCNAGICACSSSSYLQGTSCISKKANGESCSDVRECLATNSVCSSGICQCPAFRYLDGIACLNKKVNGEDCASDNECLVTDSVCNDVSRQCDCPTTRYLQGMTCINKKSNGDSCSSASECLVTDAVCSSGICSCSATKYLEGSACLAKKLNGGQCLADIECLVTGAVCDGSSGTCSCPVSMYLDGMTCKNKKQDGEICASSIECLVTDSLCSGGRCGCPTNMFLQGMTCLSKKAQGESCASSMECLVTDSECTGGLCACPDDMYLKGMTCLDKKANGAPCSSDVQCMVNACTSRVCGCPSDMYQQGMTCLNKKGYNEACVDDKECMSPDLVCGSSVCQCMAGKVYDGSVCVLSTTMSATTSTEETTTKSSTSQKPTTTTKITSEPTTTKRTTTGKPTTTKMTTTEKPTTTEEITTTEKPTTTKMTTTEKPTTTEMTSTEKPTTTEMTSTEKPTTTKMTSTEKPTTTKMTTTEKPTTTKMTTTEKPTTTKMTTTEKPTTTEMTSTEKPTTKITTTEKPTTTEMTSTEKPTPKITSTEKPTTKITSTEKPTPKITSTEKPTTKITSTEKPTPTTDETTEKTTTEKLTTTTEMTSTEKPTTTEMTSTEKPTTTEMTSTEKPTTKITTTEKPTPTTDETTEKTTTEKLTTTTEKATTEKTTTTKMTTTEKLTTTEEITTETTADTTTNKPTTSESHTTKSSTTSTKPSTATTTTTGKPTTSTKLTTTETKTTSTAAETTTRLATTSTTFSSTISTDSPQPTTTRRIPTLRTVDPVSTTESSTSTSEETTTSTTFSSTVSTDTPQPTTRRRIPTLRTIDPISTTESSTSTSEETTTSTTFSSTVSTGTPQPTTTRRIPTLRTVDPGSTTETSTTTSEETTTSTTFSSTVSTGTPQPTITTRIPTLKTDPVSTSTSTQVSTTSTSTTVMTTTSTIPAPTTVPDEIPSVVLNGTVTSNTPYDPDLADPTSNLYQNYSAEFKKTIEDGLRAAGQEGEVTNINFREGSIITDYTLVVPVVVVVVPETREDLEELSTKILEMVQPIVEMVIIEAVNNTEAPAFIQKIDAESVTPVQVMPDPPCKNGITMMDYAEQKVCGEILEYFINESMNDTCSTYLALLDCISLMYEYDSEVCSWNTMRANFETKAMTALGLQNKDVENCIPGNYYQFMPVAEIKSSSPCMDVNLMLHTAKYECHIVYSYMMTEQSLTCSDVELLESCITTRLQAHYDTCDVMTASIPQYGLTVMMDHKEHFFPGLEASLEMCEFCAAPNIEEIMRTNCILPMSVMTAASMAGSECGQLHSVIMCVEAQASLWASSNCSLDDIVSVIKSDIERFYGVFSLYQAGSMAQFSQCVDEDILIIGPELSGNLCNNHNYIAYVFMYECTDWIRITAGQVYDICSEHLLSSQCVLSHLNDVLGLQCTYDGIHRAIWERNYPVNIIDVLQTMSFPGSDCDTHYSTRSGQCEVTLMSNLGVAYEGCVLLMDEAMERKLMAIPEMACGIYAEATRCALREAVVYTDPLCKLEDIEVAMMTGVFRNYPDIQGCPSQGAGPYNREALCRSPNSLGATYLAFCGEILAPTNSTALQPCSDLQVFGECTRELGTHQDFILSLCEKSELADSFRQLDDTLIQYFAVDRQCFASNPGQCGALSLEDQVCLVSSSGNMSCMLDNECGGLEKCCSSGCDMKCSSNLQDIDPKNGTCPAIPDSVPCPVGAEDYCYVDNHCDGEAKCCYDGCRHYCREAGKIYTQADCRLPETIQSAILSCSMELTLSYDSCSSFTSLVDCVQKNLAERSRNMVRCKYENTQEDVSAQVQDLFGMYSYCRIYRAWLSVDEDGCFDPDIVSSQSVENQEYLALLTPDLETVFNGQEFKVTSLEFVGGDNCKPLMVQAYIYALTTQTALIENIAGVIGNKTASGELQRNIALIILLHEHPNFNKCTDPPTVLESMIGCFPQFHDDSYQYEAWKTCKPVHDLATCTTQKLGSVCDLQELKHSVIVEHRDTLLAELETYGQATALAEAVERYDFDSCEERGDVYPCWDEVRIDAAIDKCGTGLDLSGITVNGDATDMYGVTPEMCRHVFELMSCATEELRILGADCDFNNSYMGELVYKFVKENIPDGQLLPEKSTQILMYCKEHMPVCSAVYISKLEESQCRHPYFYDRVETLDNCSSTDGQSAFQELVTCLRLTALARGENDCTAGKIVEIIDKEHTNFNLFEEDTDLATCIGDTAVALDSQVQNRGMVCQSEAALSYFARTCGRQDCPVSIVDFPDDAELKCNTYFWLVSCVEEMAADMSFKCEPSTIASIDLTGTTLEISPATRQQCESKQTPEFTKCGYPMIKYKSEFDFCYEVAHEIGMFQLSQEDICSLYYEGMYCMKTVVELSPQIPCDPENLDNTVKDFMLDFLEVEAHTDAQMTCSALPQNSYANMFSNCSAATCEETLTNTGLLLGAAQSCGINLFTIQRDIKTYTCKKGIETFNCFTEIINEGRPALYACKYMDIMNLVLQNINPGDDEALSFNPYTCAEWVVTVTYYSKYCNRGVVPAAFETDFRTNKLPILMAGLDYQYVWARCGSVIFEVTVWTDLVEDELQQKLESVIYSNSNFSGETIAISVSQIPFDPSLCHNVEALKYFAKDCVKEQPFNYLKWHICSPVHDLADCIAEKIKLIGNSHCSNEDVIDRLFHNDTHHTQLVSRLERNIDKTTGINNVGLWLDVISQYSTDHCPDGATDIYPCENEVLKMEIFEICVSECGTELPPEFDINASLPNYGITPELCGYFFSLVSCMTAKFDELEVYCPNIPQFVYDRMKEAYDPHFVLPQQHEDIEICAAYEPVCSPQFILEARDFCPWISYKKLDCRSESDQKVALDFVNCVRLYALSKNQTECTAEKIKEVIRGDNIRLTLIQESADLDQCWPDEVLSAILPTRESVCTSGSVVTLIQWSCVTEQSLSSPCPSRAQNVLDTGDLHLGCLLYYTHLSCIQSALANMTFTCTIDQLASARVPDNSLLALRDNNTDQCLAIFNAPDYQGCEAGLISDQETLLCTYRLYFMVPIFMMKDQNTACMIYQESLSCYDVQTRGKGLTCSAEQIHDLQLSVMAISPYSMWPTTECYSPPAMFENCQAVIPEGDLCNSTDRLTNLVMGVCEDVIMADIILGMDGNSLQKCLLFQSLLWCGTNATLYAGNQCSEEQITAALLEKNDTLLTLIPGLDVDICSAEPVRWFVEVYFLNEDYSATMSDQSSLAYRRFINMKHYSLISSLSHEFSGFEIIELGNYEGKVSLAFHVMSIGDPSELLYNLVKDYEPDSSIIRVGSVYEDPAYCPPVEDWDGLVDVCAPACLNDSDCSGGQICCFQGCGLNCIEPMTSLPTEFPNQTCPTSSEVVDRVVAQCAGYVLPGIRWYGMEPCQNFSSFSDCLHEIQLPTECPDNHLWDSTAKYSSYIASVMDGFDPVECKLSHHCRDMDYLKTNILPACQNQTHMFMDLHRENGCSYFDNLLICVANEMEAQELPCPYIDMKTIVVDYIHELTYYEWHYEDHCERSQWVAELHFENETFVPGMYDDSSVSYVDFLQKYSTLISSILDRFNGGHIKYIFEGSVVLGVSFWTVKNPEDDVWMVLHEQFSADLENITVGNVYKDADQNRCLDRLHIIDTAKWQCRDLLVAMETGIDSCRTFSDLMNCIRSSLAKEEFLCDYETIVQQLNGSNSRAANSSLLPKDFDLDYCKSLKCSVWYVEMAKHEDCYNSYRKINMTVEESCRHYQEFLGCVKYQALLNDEDCPVDELDNMVRKMSVTMDLEMCISHEEFEAIFPVTKSEICNSSAVVRHLLEYQCMEFDYRVLTDPLDHCRFEVSLQGCVQETLGRDAGCSLMDVQQVMQHDEVRHRLLDSVTIDYCVANLSDSQCELEFYSLIFTKGENCLDGLGSLYYHSGILDDINNLLSAGGGKLKCSLYVEALRCFLEVANFTNTCSPLDIAPALGKAMGIYEEILPTMPSEAAYGNYTQHISFDECDVEVPGEFSVRDCRPSDVLADTVVAQCSGIVLDSSREPCMAYPGFLYCMYQVLSKEEKFCILNITWFMEEYETYISDVIDGFSLRHCKYSLNCTALMNDALPEETTSVNEKCLSHLYYLIYAGASKLTTYEVCIAYQSFLSEAVSCLVTSLPDYCEAAVTGIIQQQMYYLGSTGINNTACIDVPNDHCSEVVLGIQGIVQCGYVFTEVNAHPQCRYRSCFQALAPSDCGYTDTELDLYAGQTFQQLLDAPLAECSDMGRCMAQASHGSYKCAEPVFNITALFHLQEIYPNGNLVYGLDQACGIVKMSSLCLKKYLADDDFCQSITWSIMKEIYTEHYPYWYFDFFIDQCPDEESIDFCTSEELLILLQCYDLLPYSCNFQRCVADNLPKFSHCNNSIENQAMAAVVFKGITGTDIPACYGLGVSCDLSGCSDVRHSTCVNNMYCQCVEDFQEDGEFPLCVRPDATP